MRNYFIREVVSHGQLFRLSEGSLAFSPAVITATKVQFNTSYITPMTALSGALPVRECITLSTQITYMISKYQCRRLESVA